MPTGLGDEQLWLSATNDNTGTSTALNDLSASSRTQYIGSGVTVAADTDEGGTYALSFNGTSTRSWRYTPSLQTNGGYFGWSVWFKADAFNSSMVIAGGNAYTSLKGGLLLVDSSGNLILSLLKGTSGVPNVNITYAASLNAGQWYHATATGDGTTARLYLDGVEVGSGAFTGFPTSWERFMRLGSGGAGAADAGYGTDILFFDGLIDDARFYDRTLTQTDITHLSSSRGVIGPSYSGLGDEQLWLSPTNNNTGTSTAFQDQSGNGNNGTASGTLVVADTSEGGTYAYDFDAAGEIIEVSGLIGTTIGSVSMWAKRSAVQNTTMWFEGTNTFNSNVWDEAFFSYGVDRLVCGNSTTRTSSNLPSSGDWFHLSVLNNSGSSDIYVNGVFKESLATAAAIALASSLKFGCCSGSTVSSSIFQDDIRVFDRLLTQAEITHLASQRGIEGPPPVGLGDEQLWLCPSINDSANDISGSGNDGTYQGGMGTVADTSNGGSRCYDFDGSNDYIDLGQTLDVEYTDEASYSFWMRADDGVGSFQATMGKMLSSNTYRGHIVAYRGSSADSSKRNGITFVLRSDNSAGELIEVATANSVTAGVWTHASVTYDGSGLASGVKIYVNGVEQSGGVVADNQGTTTTVTTAPYNIGARNSNSVFFEGGLDDMRQYSRVLTQAEITHIASQRGIEGPPPVGLGDEQLWVCPTITADDVSDITGNGNTALIAGTVPVVEDTTGYESFQTDSTTLGTDYVYFDSPTGTTDPVSATIAFWAKSNFGATYRPVGGFCTTGLDDFRLFITRGPFNTARVYRRTTTSGGVDDIAMPNGASDWVDQNMHHWCLVFEGGKNKLYFDGAFLGESATALSGNLDLGSTNFSLGSQDGRTTSASASNYDDIRFYDSALTQSEITHLATSRGIEGSPSAPTAQYNAFLTHAFKQLFQTRLR